MSVDAAVSALVGLLSLAISILIDRDGLVRLAKFDATTFGCAAVVFLAFGYFIGRLVSIRLHQAQRKPSYFERRRIEKERERKRAEREAANERKAMERLCSEVRTMWTLEKRELAKMLSDGSVIYDGFVHDCPIENLARGGWALEENLPDCSIRYTPSSKAVKVNDEHPELLEAFIAEYREATK